MNSKYVVALNAHPKIGSQTLSKIAERLNGNFETAWRKDRAFLSRSFDNKILGLIFEARETYDPDEEVDKLSRLGLGYITLGDRGYPQLLGETYNAPYVLYFKGDISIIDRPAIAVVGSRKFTGYGRRAGYDLSRQCAESGLTVISGLALGIDAVAHQAALDGGGPTIGVLGCGLDRIYPVSNANLGSEIVSSGGLIISEFPPGMPPLKQNFPLRNRIIAGLSLGTLVVEAAQQSGALITAFCALEYNREVFAVPGNIDSDMSVGANMLIKQGARVVTSAADILETLNIEAKVAEDRSKAIIPETPDETMILTALADGDRLADDVIAECGMNVISFNSVISMMEMKGMVDNLGGGRYKKRKK